MLVEEYFLTGNASEIKTVVFKVSFHHQIETSRMIYTVNQWFSLFLYDENITPLLVIPSLPNPFVHTPLLVIPSLPNPFVHPKTETVFDAFSGYRNIILEPSRHLLVQSQQWKHQNNVWNRFKVNIKDTRMTSMTSFRCLYC